MHSFALWRLWNEALLLKKNFSQTLKLENITAIYKKEDLTLVKRYWPVTVLPTA